MSRQKSQIAMPEKLRLQFPVISTVIFFFMRLPKLTSVRIWFLFIMSNERHFYSINETQ